MFFSKAPTLENITEILSGSRLCFKPVFLAGATVDSSLSTNGNWQSDVNFNFSAAYVPTEGKYQFLNTAASVDAQSGRQYQFYSFDATNYKTMYFKLKMGAGTGMNTAKVTVGVTGTNTAPTTSERIDVKNTVDVFLYDEREYTSAQEETITGSIDISDLSGTKYFFLDLYAHNEAGDSGVYAILEVYNIWMEL